jgi:molybdopterin converting factor small subunit
LIVEVKIFYFSVFDKGQLTIELNENSKVKDLLEKLHNMYNDSFIKVHGKNLFDSFGSYFNVFLNGAFLHLPSDFDKMLKNGDSVLIVHPVSGG